jgi:uncharacterized protein YifN (PemK superfamily)
MAGILGTDNGRQVARSQPANANPTAGPRKGRRTAPYMICSMFAICSFRGVRYWPVSEANCPLGRKDLHCDGNATNNPVSGGSCVAYQFRTGTWSHTYLRFCDFDLARIHPENAKERRVAVLSPRAYNGRHGNGPGRCVVVPFSVSEPPALRPSDVHFPAGPYKALTKDTWANCDAVMAVSHTRLDRVYIGHGLHSAEILSEADLKRLEAGLRHALGCPLLGD